MNDLNNGSNNEYIVRVIENNMLKYLFDSQVLVKDAAFARRFSSRPLAKRYMLKSRFAQFPHRMIPVEARPAL